MCDSQTHDAKLHSSQTQVLLHLLLSTYLRRSDATPLQPSRMLRRDPSEPSHTRKRDPTGTRHKHFEDSQAYVEQKLSQTRRGSCQKHLERFANHIFFCERVIRLSLDTAACTAAHAAGRAGYHLIASTDTRSRACLERTRSERGCHSDRSRAVLLRKDRCCLDGRTSHSTVILYGSTVRIAPSPSRSRHVVSGYSPQVTVSW